MGAMKWGRLLVHVSYAADLVQSKLLDILQ
jgi:hypothetical protein